MPNTPDGQLDASAGHRHARLTGKVAVVTGVGSGIGEECALRLAREGAAVIGADLNADAAERTRQRAAEEGLSVSCVAPTDLTNPQGAAMVATAATEHDRVDILVNAAAAAVFAWIGDMTHEAWQSTLAAEVDSVFLVTQALWPLLQQSSSASIINFASANAHVALDGSAALAHCAGKGAVLAMTRQLAMEGGPHRIRANTISPALILTTATRAHLAAVPGLREQVLAKLMIKRLGETSDVADLVTFLGSDEATWITATDIRLDGGATAW